jgi:hypothetical protein
MSTWAEIRQDILVALDSKAGLTTASDLRNSVDRKLVQFRDRLYRKRPPPSILYYTDPVTVNANTTYLDILGAGAGDDPGFNLGDDYLRFTTITVEEEDWEFKDFVSWTRLKNSVGGDQRQPQSFTVDYQNYIYLRDYPTGTEEWDVVLHYVFYPGAIVDGDEPEAGRGFDDLFVTGVIRQFPKLFEGEYGIAQLGVFEKIYQESYKHYMTETEGVKKAMRLRPSIRRPRSSSVFWGTGETS